jgi:hypothetical protein
MGTPTAIALTNGSKERNTRSGICDMKRSISSWHTVVGTTVTLLFVIVSLSCIKSPNEKHTRVANDKARVDSLNLDWNPYLYAAFYGNKDLANLAQLEFDEDNLENSLSASTVFISSVQGQEGNIFAAYLDCNTYECVGFAEAWMESWRETPITGYYPFDGVVAATLPLVAAEEAYWRSTGGVREGDGNVGREGHYASLHELEAIGWSHSPSLLSIAGDAVTACWNKPLKEPKYQSALKAELVLTRNKQGYIAVFERRLSPLVSALGADKYTINIHRLVVFSPGFFSLTDEERRSVDNYGVDVTNGVLKELPDIGKRKWFW